MNENIETNVQKLRPFTKILMTIGELPTSYLMSMTYYEQLIWFTKYLQEQVIPAVNTNAQAVEELQQIVMDLQDYVNNYFDNLDVQEEINQKLDKMAEDGTLENILSAYILPIFNEYKDEIDEEISGIRTQLSTMVTYAPIPVSSTSAMTDTSRIYVLTTTGDWYYYDTTTTTWTSGGTYQASSIGDESIAGNNLYDGEITKKYNYIQNYFFGSEGQLIYSEYREYCDFYFPISNGDSYSLTNVSGVWGVLYDSNKDFLERLTTTDGVHNITGTISNANVSYIRITFTKNYDHVFKINGKDVLNKYYVDWLNIKSDNLDFGINGLNGEVISDNTIDKNKLILDNGEKLIKNSYWSHTLPAPYYATIANYDRFENLIDVEPGDVIEGKNITGSWAEYFDESGIGNGGYPYLSVITNASFVVNDQTYKIGFNIKNTVLNSAKIYKNGILIPFDNGSRDYIDWLKLNDEQIGQITKSDISRFKNYKVLFIGDSITENNYRASKNWVNYITDELNITSFLNGGMSGTGILKSFGSFPNWITKLPTYSNDYDLILIMGDMNDFSNNGAFNDSNIGNYGDTTTDTFYGALKVYLEAILTKYPLAKIGWITSTPRNQQIGSSSDYLHGKSSIFSTANDVIKEMCNNYSIPVLELYNESNLYPWISANSNEYFKPDTGDYSADAIHPNSKGQRIMAYKIKDFIIRNF